MHPHVELIGTFYRALSGRNAGGMVECYHPEIHFTDAVFDLRGPEVGAMWAMLCHRGEDLEIVFRDVVADAESGSAHWDATYTFRATGRRVRNSIDARFRFRDGRIVRHVDRFDFWKWSRQALGAPGLLLGWSGFLKKRVAREARRTLDEYLQTDRAGAIRPASQD